MLHTFTHRRTILSLPYSAITDGLCLGVCQQVAREVEACVLRLQYTHCIRLAVTRYGGCPGPATLRMTFHSPLDPVEGHSVRCDDAATAAGSPECRR
jgi:hypothetical protein